MPVQRAGVDGPQPGRTAKPGLSQWGRAITGDPVATYNVRIEGNDIQIEKH